MGITKLMRAIGKKKTATDKIGAGSRATLDYPERGEKITSPQYTFRVGVSGAVERVEVSINQGPWQPCRWSVGYWWYDWKGYGNGRYQAAVRAMVKGERVTASEPVKFTVNLR
ncbi:MAG: hypothetical protein A2X31_13345 [Elusimicrobia bacterium GWB2_63_22]|nr:MAG: hypothetical protein A2X31_13345 [Elusimicrobia bacterium GWB2_63_22]